MYNINMKDLILDNFLTADYIYLPYTKINEMEFSNGLINKDKDKLKISDDKKSLVGLKELAEQYKKQAPHFFEKKKATGYEPVDPDGNKGDDDGGYSMATNFAKEANKSESQETKSQFFN